MLFVNDLKLKRGLTVNYVICQRFKLEKIISKND